MGVPFELELHPAYLHLKFSEGWRASAGSSGDFWSVVGRLCDEHERTKVLIEAPGSDYEMDTMSAFESGRLLAENAAGITLALCVYGHEFDEAASFFKTVAQNRGVKVEMFADVESARKWLKVDTGESAAGGS